MSFISGMDWFLLTQAMATNGRTQFGHESTRATYVRCWRMVWKKLDDGSTWVAPLFFG